MLAITNHVGFVAGAFNQRCSVLAIRISVDVSAIALKAGHINH
jgi:hypothetical protein